MLQQIAYVAAISSGFVAVFTIIFAIYQYTRKNYAEELRKWQKVVIYNMILEEPGITYAGIVAKYVAESSRFQTFKLKKKDIQNDELDRVLMELIQYGLISIDANRDKKLSGFYTINTERHTHDSELLDFYKYESKKRDERIKYQGVVVHTIKNNSGKYTADSLFRELQKDFPAIDFELLTLILNDSRFKNNFEITAGSDKLSWKTSKPDNHISIANPTRSSRPFTVQDNRNIGGAYGNKENTES
jgi:hypothetical protein